MCKQERIIGTCICGWSPYKGMKQGILLPGHILCFLLTLQGDHMSWFA